MKLHNRYSYGQLFCYSGLDGETSRRDDFVAMMMEGPITLRFHFVEAVTLHIPLDADAEFQYVTGDIMRSSDCFVAFYDRNTIVGKAPIKPLIYTEGTNRIVAYGKTEKISTNFAAFYLTTEEKNGSVYFTFSYRAKNTFVLSDEELNALESKRLSYFEKMPECTDKKYEKLYYKCLSINKENVYSPEGVIPCLWTTPDRVPHRFLWLWDSVFHAMAFLQYNPEMAKNCIRAVLALQEEDGFIAHMMGVDGAFSNLTQPQVLAWGVWTIYEKCKDLEFLRECAPALRKFLIWTMENRDKNGNGLLEWLTEPDYTECKCGESGLDNSPRFDFDLEMDAIDFSTWLCNDVKYLSKIYEELEDKENAAYFANIYGSMKETINAMLWCEEDGLYYDRLFDGTLTRVATPSSFLPMLAGICSQEQADKMVKVLLDEKRFWTAMPVPTISKDSELYDIDMWRGCSWMNINYFILIGLKNYGYTDVLEELRTRSLNTVQKWYEQTGNIFEFYDADNQICPFHLKRKGEQPAKPDYRVHVHSITDYNWSACFTLLMINRTGLQ
jgi:glycogen debranching enzyme